VRVLTKRDSLEVGCVSGSDVRIVGSQGCSSQRILNDGMIDLTARKSDGEAVRGLACAERRALARWA
jgi:hypothetical protein